MPKFCIECNEKHSVFNYKGLTPSYCGKCKKENMIDLIHKNAMVIIVIKHQILITQMKNNHYIVKHVKVMI